MIFLAGIPASLAISNGQIAAIAAAFCAAAIAGIFLVGFRGPHRLTNSHKPVNSRETVNRGGEPPLRGPPRQK